MPFPFTDLKNSKVLPVLVLNALPGDDCIVCMVTTQPSQSQFAVSISPSNTKNAAVRPGTIRLDRIVTCEDRVLFKKIDELEPGKLQEVLTAAKTIFD
ncbi:MAG: type II toxin-antitoxin system PemK/MazF family toxin [Desulfomicrobium sp.]|nr:type II toxin-antitoxin system PemK/MazF family toxin [Pseudomonadota bacterium]MBV1712015.1 type II toxin-antitoxin system PemK/MazF family toxin [Desulfomicrobium sp.]MBV1719593.1 type II toxin-antitoxin system PemK/MazF family toxin [Desulfomicrobium sp.]MBV1748328.1 type II toxin-antitoxin system PemK/MazF family toxin [Desulfomicrobium sp.]